MDEKYKVAVAMTTYGGAFAEALGQALFHADQTNAAKIKATWPEEWQQYLQMYERLHAAGRIH